jgi:hypothetical protein
MTLLETRAKILEWAWRLDEPQPQRLPEHFQDVDRTRRPQIVGVGCYGLAQQEERALHSREHRVAERGKPDGVCERKDHGRVRPCEQLDTSAVDSAGDAIIDPPRGGPGHCVPDQPLPRQITEGGFARIRADYRTCPLQRDRPARILGQIRKRLVRACQKLGE